MRDDPDAQWFAQHLDRQAHIRLPVKVLEMNKQRAVAYMDESEREFRTLGPHDKGRRRILLWRVPKDNPYQRTNPNQILKIPFLAFADEAIEDDDATLLPILHGIMEEARANG